MDSRLRWAGDIQEISDESLTKRAGKRKRKTENMMSDNGKRDSKMAELNSRE